MALLHDYGRFAVEFIRAPKLTGAIAPSSRALADCMLDSMNLRDATVVCEYGPGTGTFTQAVLERIGPKTKFFAIEKNPAMVAVLHKRFPGVSIHEASILDVAQVCRSEGVSGIDAVISGLPWASFSAELQAAALAATWDALNQYGRFVTFAYPIGKLFPNGRRFTNSLRKQFAVVAKSRLIWGNLPPAFAYRCVK